VELAQDVVVHGRTAHVVVEPEGLEEVLVNDVRPGGDHGIGHPMLEEHRNGPTQPCADQ